MRHFFGAKPPPIIMRLLFTFRFISFSFNESVMIKFQNGLGYQFGIVRPGG
ncbi:hypothetical protein PF011_g30946 [Phytophthora fragariae]|uniref:Uncharacterized protein n=1 Tax=Phytophthora fragariae TaxID=53985 RepID=A0A6A3GKN9_9STRA|nr:hypothetical protein PF011_g30946 [Phytophthora fragariae]